MADRKKLHLLGEKAVVRIIRLHKEAVEAAATKRHVDESAMNARFRSQLEKVLSVEAREVLGIRYQNGQAIFWIGNDQWIIHGGYRLVDGPSLHPSLHPTSVLQFDGEPQELRWDVIDPVGHVWLYNPERRNGSFEDRLLLLLKRWGHDT